MGNLLRNVDGCVLVDLDLPTLLGRDDNLVRVHNILIEGLRGLLLNAESWGLLFPMTALCVCNFDGTASPWMPQVGL